MVSGRPSMLSASFIRGTAAGGLTIRRRLTICPTKVGSSEESVPSGFLPGAGGLGLGSSGLRRSGGGVERGGESGDGDQIGRRLGRLAPLEEFVDEARVQVGGAELGVFQDLA